MGLDWQLQALADHPLQLQALVWPGQAQAVDGALAAETFRQVRVVVAGDAVGPQRDDLAQRLAHAVAVLVRQAVEQVEAQ